MLSSLEVIQATGISRATLNNYIALGLLPRPLVRNPGGDARTRARQVGYFPPDVIERIQRIQQLKKQGVAMQAMTERLGAAGVESISPQTAQAADFPLSSSSPALEPAQKFVPAETGPLRLTIDRLPCPAYMLNYRLELTWYNEEARVSLLGSFERLPADIKERNVLDFFGRGQYGKHARNGEVFKLLHQQMGRDRQTDANGHASLGDTAMVASPITEWPLILRSAAGNNDHYQVYASYFREGILVIFANDTTGHTGLLGMLERRDDVIRNLLKKRLPVLTDVAVLVADLQNSVRICSELPPEEYFELINQIWATMEPILRNYNGTHGKHVGDGMVYYFFPQPDSNYIYNALRCANQMRDEMRKISKTWQLRKKWMHELYLNTGLNEGQEWLGVFHIETKIEFTVLGDTINHAARLSDFARHGSLWATKNLMGKLSTEERNKVRFGVKREDQERREVFVEASYSRISELVDLASPRHERLRDIAALAVTEIVELV